MKVVYKKVYNVLFHSNLHIKYEMQKKRKYCSEVLQKSPQCYSCLSFYPEHMATLFNVSIQLFLVSFTLVYKLKHVAMPTGFEHHALK